ncbi:uncharacterized protein LAJ45_03931 [Morchella importuna]|uniref:uncharacterized protein n=1 Tax=Morchella importuna TaxID=1174673 RepID=UPI001E8DE296|nr:uncharacterized protein LAJ45_03931 [Morchella importuna]KAH8151938.1 hypothetical protein LAJ45_03931 [Morchella importuna]
MTALPVRLVGVTGVPMSSHERRRRTPKTREPAERSEDATERVLLSDAVREAPYARPSSSDDDELEDEDDDEEEEVYLDLRLPLESYFVFFFLPEEELRERKNQPVRRREEDPREEGEEE